MMSDQSLPFHFSQPPVEPAKSFAWNTVWTNAFTRPNPRTYRELIDDPQAGITRAYLWVFLLSLLVYGVQYGAMVARLGVSGLQYVFGLDTTGLLGVFLCGIPLAAVLSVIGLIITGAISTVIARELGGEGTFYQVVYGRACYYAPVMLVTSLLGLISWMPYIDLLAQIGGVLLILYALILDVVVMKASHRFSWFKAVVSSRVLVLALVLIVAMACNALVLLSFQ
ncbi:MAG: YIP1 family protein [Aggregatilineales bacterium]|jgi:hypothetical protein|nr:hypothetical protein [Chloroflexota bacterium]HOA24096.1 YIP1 family protein [Aggregatilineales bacterium]HPV07579.1 YIP1 family protein [Aggregatilineales bacterium]HQE19857.1 YIP1 family protein [Aggregatilineales bacterium]